jgi:hypothetical protein
MSTWTHTLNGLRQFRLSNVIRLRPHYPPVALEIDRDEIVLVRVKSRSRGGLVLEAHQSRPVEGEGIPASIFEPVPPIANGLADKIRELYESTATRPGRVSLVLPDNLAKITLLQLPERPASTRQLEELVRAKMRRAVPFKLDDASLTYQTLPGPSGEFAVLVVLVRRALVERLERVLESFGARPGLVDICTSNLINLCRQQLEESSRTAGDAALLNCAGNYFSLVIVREGRLIFFRCKTFAPAEHEGSGPNGLLLREVSNSFSYYREKLAGEGVHTVFVRTVSDPFEKVADKLAGLGCERVERIDPTGLLTLGEGVSLDSARLQRIAPAIGAVAGRS